MGFPLTEVYAPSANWSVGVSDFNTSLQYSSWIADLIQLKFLLPIGVAFPKGFWSALCDQAVSLFRVVADPARIVLPSEIQDTGRGVKNSLITSRTAIFRGS